MPLGRNLRALAREESDRRAMAFKQVTIIGTGLIGGSSVWR